MLIMLRSGYSRYNRYLFSPHIATEYSTNKATN
jgi:hypothetical protein